MRAPLEVQPWLEDTLMLCRVLLKTDGITSMSALCVISAQQGLA